MRTEIIREAAEHGVLLAPELTELCLSQDDPLGFVKNLLYSVPDKFYISLNDIPQRDFGDVLPQSSPMNDLPHAAPVRQRRGEISIVPGTDITGESTCEGKIADFQRYFQSRYRSLRKILERRRELAGALPIERAMHMDREVIVIGMVADVSNTKNGHCMIILEDESGECKVFISKDSPLITQAVVLDEVIGVVGKPTQRKEMLIPQRIVYPDIPMENRMKPSDSCSQIGFLSDIHVGSSTFLQDHWDRMIGWLKTESEKLDLNYLVLPGDVVDGIGIYPGQFDELTIDNIYRQYERLSELLKEIPDHITIVLQPGNHDAVRPAEPQPALPEIFSKDFDSNIILAGNPVYLKVEDRTILSYHGRSIDDWVSSVQSLSYDQPLDVMVEMLKRRHLAPIYGKKTPLSPEKKDYLVIDPVPDIFVTGHVHGVGHSEYKGVKIINASTWQSQTEFQRMHNFNPQPAIMPMVHLGTGKVTMMDFN
ncbi:MAG: polymerase small subunit [Candidatus Methanomethylophilaceae archaeon]|nr:polymerase small subunit [Candidatus Methanomethylophilaceae archaeon]HIJ00373.1 DNA-directed DNA polymerase II small subunit [Candidatus Methanomethylophilaceae archaeon]